MLPEILRKYLHRVAGAAMIAASAAAPAATWVYVANADSQEISVLQLDRAAGMLKAVSSVAVGGTAMPMVVSRDKRFLYVALRSQPFRVVSFAIDANGGSLSAKAAGVTPFLFTLACDATVTVDTTSALRTITITYAGNCSGTRTRTGSVIASFSPGFKWSNAGAQITITFNNLTITHKNDGKSVVINGFHESGIP